jgi:hypothetical protein
MYVLCMVCGMYIQSMYVCVYNMITQFFYIHIPFTILCLLYLYVPVCSTCVVCVVLYTIYIHTYYVLCMYVSYMHYSINNSYRYIHHIICMIHYVTYISQITTMMSSTISMFMSGFMSHIPIRYCSKIWRRRDWYI